MRREKLIEYRGKRTQAYMAGKYGVSQQAWCKWENGESKPGVVIMKQMEIDSGIPMETLFFDVFNKHNLSNN
jgi:transcriptional regulator with XRE-family HTH domain